MAAIGRRKIARILASAGFLLLIVGITYFAILVFSVRFAEEEGARAASFIDLADFVSGRRAWYQDARTYGASALVLALVSLLFGVHPLARITLPVAILAIIGLQVYGEELRELIIEWARKGGGS